MMRTLRAVALLGVLAVLAGACSLPGNIEGSREVTATFDDVGDLVSGHSVQVADVRIGSIKRIELTDDFRAVVTMSLKDGVFIPKESQAVLRTTSLLGEKFIELRPIDAENPMAGTDLVDGDEITETIQGPELEFVAEQAVQLLGSVVAADVATLVEVGSTGFGGRAAELTTLVESLSTVSATLADQTDEIVRIIDGLDGAASTLAASSADIDRLLVDLAAASSVLADNRDRAVDAVREITRLAQVQNDIVFEPYLAEVDQQIGQVDAILAELAEGQGTVRQLLGVLGLFTDALPRVAPENFAQVYALFEVQL